MIRRIAAAAMFAGLMLGASGVLAQQDPTTAKTTNTYDATSTSEDIRVSCKELSVDSLEKLNAKCNKANSAEEPTAVSAVSTSIKMPTYTECTSRDRVDWGSGDRIHPAHFDRQVLCVRGILQEIRRHAVWSFGDRHRRYDQRAQERQRQPRQAVGAGQKDRVPPGSPAPVP